MQRIRLMYSRSESFRYTGHLDMQTFWERALRRAKMPLLYSQGFHPQPRINQASPLPLGMTSNMELMDFWIEPDMMLFDIQQQLTTSLPVGVQIISVNEIDLKEPSLQSRILSSKYLVTFLVPFDEETLRKRVDDFLSLSTLKRIRREKTYDLRPLVLDLKVLQTDVPDKPHLLFHLSAKDGATGRPEEVISALDYDPLDMRYIRIELLLN